MIGDGRRPDAPPCDSLAEAMVLQWLVVQPDRLDTVENLADLFVFPEHRVSWQAVVHTRMRYPDASGADFFLHWLEDLESLQPPHFDAQTRKWMAHCTADTILSADQSTRAFEEADVRPRHESGRLKMSEYFHSFHWWVDRMRKVAEARRLISAAQTIADCAWRVPDRPFSGAEAAVILEKAVPPQRPTLADRVLRV